MSNDPEKEPSRFFSELGNDGWYYIHDREDRIKSQGPFYDTELAREHIAELNRIVKRIVTSNDHR